MEAKLNQCQIKTCKATTQNVQGLDQESVVAEEAVTPEKNEQEETEESGAVRSNKPKVDDEVNIPTKEKQISSINSEKHGEETAAIQPAGADIVDDTKKEQRSTKNTTGVQADR